MAEVPSPSQTAALLDILTHYDTYAQIREFRRPGSLARYGPPFTAQKDTPSNSPALQALVSRYLLNLPGLNNLPEKWWTVQCHEIIENLEKANLSESYDKGVIGSRKTLATAISALIEYPVRGTFAGFPRIKDRDENYDLTNAEDLRRAFRDFLHESVYGDILDQMVEKTATTDNLEDHPQLTKAVHEFVLVNLASLMHYTLILSPKGQYLLKLVDNANKLVPYMVLRQTLKIGNVATMINAMVKVGLAKMSVASVTNWMGLTKDQDEGSNLMQTIISTVLGWDIKDLELRGSRLGRERAQLGKEQLLALKEYTTKSQDEQDRIRKESQTQSISIVTAILKDAKSPSTELTDVHHKQALEYLSIQLSIRDRRQLIQVLCKSTPDHLTMSVREVVDAYEPVIRRMHKAIDLASTLSDFEYFLKDLIKLARIRTDHKTNKAVVPTVGDFVQLLRKHQRSCHVFMHQCAKNDKELTGWYLDWAKTAASQFKQDPDDDHPGAETAAKHGKGGAGNLTPALHGLFASLDEATRSRILPILDSHSDFLEDMHAQSLSRLASVLKSPPSKNPHIAKIFSSAPTHSSSSSRPSSRPPSPAPPPERSNNGNTSGGTETPTPTSIVSEKESDTSREIKEQPTPTEVSSSPGPGAFLARWQALLDATPITPLTQHGSLKAASSPEVVQSSATDVDGSRLVDFAAREAKGEKIRVEDQRREGSEQKTEEQNQNRDHKTDEVGIGMDARKRQRELRVVIDALGREFRDLLAKRGCYW
ncbi:succinate dehydrogenase (ubiquinone) flavoprotein subunit [Cladophialophora carrionii]|uniref:Succinate dehydrogenase (Ubiquinone) flavoprotein subunit n=1 Tax=Cladophialophora carrionii TaxID=86049 RepID=A0A1C1CJ18_9EURO|nr:succinate dehydrogenase (ubiquinone) flavoprotein subunit [Cladophialophora carrionii]